MASMSTLEVQVRCSLRVTRDTWQSRLRERVREWFMPTPSARCVIDKPIVLEACTAGDAALLTSTIDALVEKYKS